MKITQKIAILLATIFFTAIPSSQLFAQGYYENWEISSFNSNIVINNDSSADITETIVADFTNEAHRGIARMLPYDYETGGTDRTTPIEFESATDENGNSWNIKTYKENGYLTIEMTNKEDIYNNNVNTFVIKYKVKNVANFFEDHSEFYWNVNGTDWAVPVKKIEGNIHLPKGIDPKTLQIDCLTGFYAEAKKDCQYTQTDLQTIYFESTKPFEAYENLTMVIGIPKEVIAPPSQLQKTLWLLEEYWGLFIPILTFIIMLSVWYKYGRDDQTVRDAIMPHYKPPEGLLPTETGTIIDEKIDPRDITSTIIDFAIKGYIKITEIIKKGLIFKDTDYELELIKQPTNLKAFEKLLLDGIFTKKTGVGEKIKISELKNKFYTHIDGIKKSVMEQLINDGYFPHNPSIIRTIYASAGGATAILSFQLMALAPIPFLGVAISGIIIAIIGYFLPRKTKKGTETYYILKGLYEYINTAEKDRMKFQEANNILFEKLLPYAISFGLAKKWASAFDGLIKNPPIWYHSTTPWGVGHFGMIAFADHLNSFSNNLTSNIVSKPGGRSGGGSSAWHGGSGFGGGGFSGGGFGGGGGHGL